MRSDQSPETVSSRTRRMLWLPLLLVVLFVLHKISMAVLFQNPVRDLEALEGSQKRHLVLAVETQEDLTKPKAWDFTKLIYQVCPRRTDGVVQPLFPWSVVVFSDFKELTEHAQANSQNPAANVLSDQDRLLYNHGRWLNLIITMGFLSLLGLWLLWRYSGVTAINLVILAGLGSLIPRSAYFQAEILYYLFFFLSWITCFSIFKKNAIWKYALLGVLTGTAYLAKDEIYPLILCFIVITLLRCAWERWSSGKARFLRLTYCHWLGRNNFIGLIAFGVMHLMVIGPRLVYSYETYGSFYHSYLRHWAWLDQGSSKGAKDEKRTVEGWMLRYDDPALWRKMARSGGSSSSNLTTYISDHETSEIVHRLQQGIRRVLHEFLWPVSTPWQDRGKSSWRYLLDYRGLFLTFTGLMVCVAYLARYRQKTLWIQQDCPWFKYGWSWSFGMVLMSSALYIAIYGWYHPVLKGERFYLSLFVPLVYSGLIFSDVLVRGMKFDQSGKVLLGLHHLLKISLLGVLLWRLIELLRYPDFALS